MSDHEAMEAAGATVHLFKEFGSYQGDWYALVTVNGEKGWINGSYGSCSGCDAFQAEFSYGENDGCVEHRYDKHDDCPACIEHQTQYYKKLADFGRTYLGTLMTQEAVEQYAAKNIEWSEEDREALAWLKANRINGGKE